MRITANQVTIARLIGLPFVGALSYGDEQMRIMAVIIGTLIGLTDTVDGYLARKHGVTVLGSLLDPVADKVFIIVSYGICADRGLIPWWVAAAILSRELGVTVLAIQPRAARPPPAQHQRRQGEDLGADAGHRVRRAVADRGGARVPDHAVRGAAGGSPADDGDPALHAGPPLPADRVRGDGAGGLPRRPRSSAVWRSRASPCWASSSR